MKMTKDGPCRLQKRLGCSGHLCPDAAADWPLRSTWALHRGAWTQLEDPVKYASLELPNAPLKPSAEKLITRFEKYRVRGFTAQNVGNGALVPQPSTERVRLVAKEES